MALDKAGIKGPYVLCPHSLSGLEALYWAQKYPDEVEAIVGLDMAVPTYYDEMDISIPMTKLGHYAAVLGITRWIPSLAESDAIKYGTLSENEKDIYRAVFYQRTATETMVDEVKEVKDNANIVKEMVFRKCRCYCLYQMVRAEQVLQKNVGEVFLKNIFQVTTTQAILN